MKKVRYLGVKLTDDVEPLFDALVAKAKESDPEQDQSTVVRNMIRKEAEREGVVPCPA